MVALTAGQRHESPQAIPLLEQATDRMWPEAVAGDKGYSAADLRNWLQERDIEPVIPYREDESGSPARPQAIVLPGHLPAAQRH